MSEKHTEEFIEEMRGVLEQEEKRLMTELKAISHQTDGDTEADFPDYGRNDEDNATEIADYQALSSTATVIEERLKDVQAALARIEAGKYGTTEDGRMIPENRLRANPAAKTLVE